MCGRYTLIRLNDILERFPWIQHVPPLLAPRYNIAPTQPVLAIANDHPDQFDHLTWGFVPSWAKDPSIGNRMINARAETLAE
jgi:putative SOS response-associated peptidase YedK